MSMMSNIMVIGMAVAASQTNAANEPPIVILSAWLERDKDGDPMLLVKYRANERFIGVRIAETWFDKGGKEITDNGGPPPTRDEVLAAAKRRRLPPPATPQRDLVKQVTRAVPTAPYETIVNRGGGGTEKGEVRTDAYEFRREYSASIYHRYLPTVPQIVLMKCQVNYVLLEGNKFWFPPKNKPLTFEARFKQPEDHKDVSKGKSKEPGVEENQGNRTTTK